MSASFEHAPLTVRQLNLYVKSILDGNIRLSACAVTGEISNLKTHFSSGHVYFTLKDESAAVKCVMFRSFAARAGDVLCEGARLTCFGHVSLYERDGSYQFYVEALKADGIGDAALRLEKLKKKLMAEGLFAVENKRLIPRFPKRIAVVTSGGGAALQDIINVISRRCPVCELVLYSVSVQGEHAVPEMLNALDLVYQCDDIDTLIIGRGGGSKEDLSVYNDEQLARKLYESPFPVISAVGHETDLCICDLVADLRAPTPSAAAELAVPDVFELQRRVVRLNTRISALCNQAVRLSSERMKSVGNLPVFSRAATFVEAYALLLDRLNDRIFQSLTDKQRAAEKELSDLALRVDAMSPLKVLARGYAVVQKDDKPVCSANMVIPGDKITLKMTDGSIRCTVNAKEN